MKQKTLNMQILWWLITETYRKTYSAGALDIATLVTTNGFGSINWLLNDHLGSTAITVRANGTKSAELRYSAFGETRYTSGTTPTDYRYTGQLQQGAVNLYYYNARWYDPKLARFTQADTIIPSPTDPQSWDRYAYVKNNPMRYTDPSGNKVCEGVDTCDAKPKSSYSKKYYQNRLAIDYDWHVSNEFTYSQVKFIYDKAWDWRQNYSNVTSGLGEKWMEKNLGRVNFQIDTFEQNVISKFAKSPVSVVLGNTVYFSENFMNGTKLEQDIHIFHEITHVWDNSSLNEVARGLGKQATFFGGGISDEFIKYAGGDPSGLRFMNGNFEVASNYVLVDDDLHRYGNNSYADYFAQVNALRMVGDRSTPLELIMWIEAIINLTK